MPVPLVPGLVEPSEGVEFCGLVPPFLFLRALDFADEVDEVPDLSDIPEGLEPAEPDWLPVPD